MTNSAFSLQGKRGLIVGLANEHSIAYGCARVARKLGAQLVISCVNQKAEQFVAPLIDGLDASLVVCDVEQDGALENLVDHAVQKLGQLDFDSHSIAWERLDNLHWLFIKHSNNSFFSTN